MLPETIPVWDLIGRALVVYDGHEGQSPGATAVAAVIARSAVAGDNTKKVCACDGTLIWESGDLIPPRPKRA
jgi:copper chaperone for superoxide dismutase